MYQYRFHLFQVQIATIIQHPRLLAQARQNLSSSCPAQDGIQRQATSVHCRDKQSLLILVERYSVLSLSLPEKNCHRLDNNHSWPHVTIDFKKLSSWVHHCIYSICPLVVSVLSLSVKPLEHRQPLPWPHHVKSTLDLSTKHTWCLSQDWKRFLCRLQLAWDQKDELNT